MIVLERKELEICIMINQKKRIGNAFIFMVFLKRKKRVYWRNRKEGERL